MTPTRDQLISIQFLRGIAAFMVMFAHAQTETMQLFGLDRYAPVHLPGGFGVDIFFVVSGFIMVYASQNLFGKPGSSREFLKRRAIRIVPLYWFYTSAMVVATLLFADRLNSAVFEPYNAVLSYLFVPAMAPKGEIVPILDLGWTLNYEMFFYVVFACAIGLPMRRAVTVVVVAISAIAALGAVLPMPGDALTFWTRGIIVEFAFGCILGFAYIARGRRERWTPFLLAVVLSLAWYYAGRFDLLPSERFVDRGVAAAILVYGFVFHMPVRVEAAVRPIARWLGDSSYSLYLSHPFALAIVAMAWPGRGFLSDAPLVYLCVATAAAVVGGILSFLILEDPVTRLLNRMFRRKRPTPVRAGQGATEPAAQPGIAVDR